MRSPASVGQRGSRTQRGAELCPFTSSSGDPADEYASQGRFFWNELHTTDPAKALAFYNHDYYLQWTRRFRILM